MSFKNIFPILVLGLALSGCCHKEKSPYSAKIREAEEYFLRIKPKKALEILSQIDSSAELPDRYYRLRYQAELRDFQFSQSFKTILTWRKKSSKKQEKALKSVLKAFLRYCTELKNPGLRLEAIRALGELKDREASDLIMGLFPGGSQSTRISVCYAMCLLGDEKRALPYLVDRSRFSGLKGRFLASLYLVQLKDPELVNEYINLLQDPDDAVRVLAIKVLGEMKAEKALEKLEIIYQDTASIHVKMLAAQALTRLGKYSYKEFIQQQVSDQNSGVNAKILLTELGDSRHLESLKGVLDRLEVEAQYSIMKALIKAGEKEFVRNRLHQSLESLLGNAFEKKMALELLLTVREPSDWDLIQSHFFSPFQEVQVMAAKTMLQFLEN